jgi:hypothetical protein
MGAPAASSAAVVPASGASPIGSPDERRGAAGEQDDGDVGGPHARGGGAQRVGGGARARTGHRVVADDGAQRRVRRRAGGVRADDHAAGRRDATRGERRHGGRGHRRGRLAEGEQVHRAGRGGERQRAARRRRGGPRQGARHGGGVQRDEQRARVVDGHRRHATPHRAREERDQRIPPAAGAII